MIVTICGSTKFKEQILSVAKDLSLYNNIVLLPLVFPHAGDVITKEQKANLDRLHLQKIDLSQAIYVINVGNYIGESTSREIRYATAEGKPVYYLEAQDAGHTIRSTVDPVSPHAKQG